jgi:3-phosphoshikimate 1-carboxyvinyltransferase
MTGSGRGRTGAGESWVEKLHGANVHGWHDHRIVMALTVAGGKRIDTAEAVDVSYQGFF